MLAPLFLTLRMEVASFPRIMITSPSGIFATSPLRLVTLRISPFSVSPRHPRRVASRAMIGSSSLGSSLKLDILIAHFHAGVTQATALESRTAHDTGHRIFKPMLSVWNNDRAGVATPPLVIAC